MDTTETNRLLRPVRRQKRREFRLQSGALQSQCEHRERLHAQLAQAELIDPTAAALQRRALTAIRPLAWTVPPLRVVLPAALPCPVLRHVP